MVLFISMVSVWISVIAGTYQRIFAMPKWFAKPPESFELIRKQNKLARRFWIPLSIVFIISLAISIIIYIDQDQVRNFLLAAFVCFAVNGALSGVYFAKEIIAFTKVTVDSPLTGELQNRVRFWLRWTILRDMLQLFTAIFVTIAYSIVISII